MPPKKKEKEVLEYPREMHLRQYFNGLYITMRPHNAGDIIETTQYGQEVMIHFGVDKSNFKVILGVEIIAFPPEDFEENKKQT